jgi:hypothetical protein
MNAIQSRLNPDGSNFYALDLDFEDFIKQPSFHDVAD